MSSARLSPTAIPDVSVILVTYNRAAFLARTLDCILCQTHPNFELFICDDCSSDKTPDVCRAYADRDSRICYVRNSFNMAMPGNLNAGIRRSNCEFVAILHDGDIYYPTIIEKWRAALLRNPTAGFVFNVYRHLSPDGHSGDLTATFAPLIPGSHFLEAICFRDKELECPVWGTVMVRRSVLQELDFFDPRYGFWSDFDMWFRIAESHDIAFVPEPLIDLPNRSTMPHLFKKGAFVTHSTIFQMFWAARRRHYRGRPAVMTYELAKQIVYFVPAKAKRLLRRLFRNTAKTGTAWQPVFLTCLAALPVPFALLKG